MSSIRVALGSLVLMLALGAGSWEAVKAFPLYGGMEQQAPPRDPISAEQYHRTAILQWDIVMRDPTLTTEQKRQQVLKGIAAENHALALKPDYVDALLYKNILLRVQALLSDDPQEANDLIKQADALRNQVLALQAARAVNQPWNLGPQGEPRPAPLAQRMPPPPPPAPPAPEFQALIDQYQPARVGGEVKAPTKIRDVKPAYPPIAQSANVAGVVIIEAILDADGTVVGARVLRSIPLLDEAALDAVRQWRFTPPLVDGVPRAVLMTVTVNFTLRQQ